MLVSIITPVYNASFFLRQAATSVLAQTYQDWEWLLVDDCSSDNSWELMQELAKEDYRIKIFRNTSNLKSGKTRNFAIEKASGRFIAFLDSDDMWHKDKLTTQVKFMEEKKCALSHTSFGYLNEIGHKIKSTFHVSNSVNYDHLLKRTEIGCSTVMYDTSILGKRYMSSHSRRQDYALWLSILKEGVLSYGIDSELSYYRITQEALSKKNKLILSHISFLKETQGFNTIKALYYTAFWMINGFVRYFLK